MRRFSIVRNVCSFKRLMGLKVSGRIDRLLFLVRLRRFGTGSTLTRLTAMSLSVGLSASVPLAYVVVGRAAYMSTMVLTPLEGPSFGQQTLP